MQKMNIRQTEAPVYREVLRHAFKAAWEEKRFWPLALGASILFTAGSYDVFIRAADFTSTQSAVIASNDGRITAFFDAFTVAATRTGNILNVVFGLQLVVFVAIVAVAVLAFACVCQGGLVFALGASKRGEKPTIGQALKVGSLAFWPVAALNALVLSLIWILRFMAVLPLALALSNPSKEMWILHFVSFIVFFGLQFMLTIMQGFALNAIILQGASPAEAIIRAEDLLKRHWVVAVETAAILAIIAGGIVIAFFGLAFVLVIPLVMAIITSAVIKSAALYYGAFGVFTGLMIMLAAATLSFLIQLQYATWTYLYRRLGEGGVLPKLHRIYRALTGRYPIED